MDNRYRVIFSGKNLYKEMELAQTDRQMRFGTENMCEVRVRKDMFFEPVILYFTKDDQGAWNLSCSDHLYLETDNVSRHFSVALQHGTEFDVCYQDSGNVLMHVQFMIDFAYMHKEYNRCFDINSVASIAVGASSDCQIRLQGSYVKNDKVILTKQGNNAMLLTVYATSYGVYHNGNPVVQSAMLEENDFFSIADYSFCYKSGCLYTQRSVQTDLPKISYTDIVERKHYPEFYRNPRIKTVLNEEKIEVLDPPEIPKKPKNNLMMRLLPSIGMLAVSAVMAVMGGVYIFISLASGVVSVITALLGVRESKKDYKKAKKDRIQKYEAYMDSKKQEIIQARAQELAMLQQQYSTPEEEIQNLQHFSGDLFDRCKDDEDFLDVRLGLGKREAVRKIEYRKQERLEIEDELQSYPKQLYDRYKYIEGAPIVCGFREAGAVGIVGDENYQIQILQNGIVDLCARQFHSDVAMHFIATEEHAELMHQFRMLPHVQNNILGIHNIVCNDQSRAIIFEYLYKEMTFRTQNKISAPHMLVFLYDAYGFYSHPLSKFVEHAKDIGVTFVFFGNTKEEVGLGCRYLIIQTGNGSGRLQDTNDRDHFEYFVYEAVRDSDIKGMIQLLTPVYTEGISLEQSLTKQITLFDLYHILSADDVDLAGNWSKSKVWESMAAPIGVSKNGVIQLDLHDAAHGPHGLVAGTTGSGKSEILQTYILSMAMHYHPYEVGFVLIDFKGGGMADQFAKLPHLLGTITDLDGKEIDRSLKSIAAELNKRKTYFHEADVNHIDQYIAKYRSGIVKKPLPHLIIIVDEFAELKANQPEFMKELISASRIGRSLGVHLILATQKPSGQVDEQIWSNSRFRLCLKVQTQQDSNEVLKSPLAAEIREPGRAYLQVGNNEIFELFQSAYSGAPEQTDEANTKEFAIYEITPSAKRIPVFAQKKKKEDRNVSTQLRAVVRYIESFCDTMSIEKLPNICLPSLSRQLLLSQIVTSAEDDSHIVVPLGRYDDPDHQIQADYTVDFSKDNVMIIGSTQSGKTNLLQAMIRGLASKYTPQDVCIYIIDFASMYLTNFASLHHVGGVVTASDDEKLKNLFKLLEQEVKERKERLLAAGVSSYSAYREAGKRDMPQIILMIDNLTALRELYYEESEEELLGLCRESVSVGISIVIANSQTTGISYKYLANFASRIALYNNDAAEYSTLFEHCREQIENTPGRALIELDKKLLECQIYLAFEGEKEIDRANETARYIQEINRKYADMHARRIPEIPQLLSVSYVEQEYGECFTDYQMVAGVDYATVSPFVFSLSQLNVIAVSGRDGMGKHNFLCYLIRVLEQHYSSAAEVYIMDGINRRLQEKKDSFVVKQYEVLADRVCDLVQELHSKVESRYQAVAQGDYQVLETEPLLVLILNNRDALEILSGDTKRMEEYSEMVGKYKNMKVCVFIADFENTRITYSSADLAKQVRDGRHILFFEDIANMKILDDLPLSVTRAYKKPIVPGEMYYIKENEVYKVKTPIITNE